MWRGDFRCGLAGGGGGRDWCGSSGHGETCRIPGDLLERRLGCADRMLVSGKAKKNQQCLLGSCLERQV